MSEITVARLAEVVAGELIGDAGVRIQGVAPLDTAGPTELSFVANARYLPYLQRTRAGALLVQRAMVDSAPAGAVLLVVDDPHAAMYRALKALFSPPRRAAEIHPTAVVAEDAVLGDGVAVGAYAVIGAGARIGAGATVAAHVVVGEGSEIGEETVLHPHATVHPGVTIGARCVIHSGARIGREGFGFVWLDGGHQRVPQVGGCILGDDVEVGANSNIDRGSIGDTVIGSGTKIDSLVHLGHNVKVGRHVLIIAQVGVSGSTTIGDGAIIAGQAGVGGHLTIGAGARIGAQGGVTADVPAGETYSGYPARPHRESLRAQAALFRLPELTRRMREIERMLAGRTAPGAASDATGE